TVFILNDMSLPQIHILSLHDALPILQVNLSDIYAMNGTASQVTFSIGLSSKFPLEAVEELYAGALLACKNYQVDLVGGDTSASVDRKSTRLNSSHVKISYAVFCLKKK